MSRRAAPPSRTIVAARRRRVIKVFTEGRLTEVEYLAKWANELRFELAIDIDRFHGTPLALVHRAVDLRRAAGRTSQGVAGSFDELWCVFDCDEHPHVDEARRVAAQNDIRVAYSNPCFELWRVLHRQDLRRATDRHAIRCIRIPDLHQCGWHGFGVVALNEIGRVASAGGSSMPSVRLRSAGSGRSRRSACSDGIRGTRRCRTGGLLAEVVERQPISDGRGVGRDEVVQ